MKPFALDKLLNFSVIEGERGVRVCDHLIDTFLEVIHRSPHQFLLVMRGCGKRPRSIPENRTKILKAIRTLNPNFLYEKTFLIHEENDEDIVQAYSCSIVLAIKTLLELKKHLAQQDLNKITYSCSQLTHIFCSIKYACYYSPAMRLVNDNRGTRTFRDSFIRYLRSIMEASRVTSPKIIWTFLRESTANGPISLDNYYFQISDEELHYSADDRRLKISKKVTKHDCSKYFAEAKERVSFLKSR